MKKLLVLVLLTSILVMGTMTVNAQSDEPEDVGAPKAASCLLYNVTISGVAGGWTFTRTGVLALYTGTISKATVNGINPREVWIISGSPVNNPSTGAIRFTTNTYFIANNPALSTSRTDLAFVKIQNGYLTATPDSSLSATTANIFTTTSGLATLIRTIRSGNLTATFPNNGYSVRGSILFTDTVIHSTYQANFSGRYARTVSASQCRYNIS